MLGIHLLRGLEARVHHRFGEHLELRVARAQALERLRIAGLVFARHLNGRHIGGGAHGSLVFVRQLVKGLVVDEKVKLRARFPPARVVVIRRHFAQAEFFIVIRPHELGGVQRAFFQRLIHVAARHVLRHHAQLGHHFAKQAAAQTHLQALEVIGRLDFLAVPAAHLRGCVARAQRVEVVFLEKLVQQFAAIALAAPGFHLQRGQAKRHGAGKGENGIFAREVIAGGLRNFNVVVLNRVQHAESGHQLACGVHRHLELAARQRLDHARKRLGAAHERVQRLRKARSHAPAHRLLRLHGRGHASGQHASQASAFDERTTIHDGGSF